MEGEIPVTEMSANQLSNYLELMVKRVTDSSVQSIQNSITAQTEKINVIQQTSIKTEKKVDSCVAQIDEQKRLRNLIIFGMSAEGNQGQIECKVLDFFNSNLDCKTSLSDIDFIRKLGKGKNGNPPPILVGLTSLRTKSLVFSKVSRLKGTNISLSYDYNKETLAKRKSLYPMLTKLKSKGFLASLKGGDLYVDNQLVGKIEAERLLSSTSPRENKRPRDINSSPEQTIPGVTEAVKPQEKKKIKKKSSNVNLSGGTDISARAAASLAKFACHSPKSQLETGLVVTPSSTPATKDPSHLGYTLIAKNSRAPTRAWQINYS